ncbi:hypothetical protein CEXT_783001 [Caerostris extrusa]|uniref:Uncharacterized protein n=1 Tax=Caerostris extrusa TaxID=172846 RepID=A0AAV4R3Z6_CAEEX|nr:hypothetical protein CEXT_783001 [Caerostris extrusa]
MKAGRYRTNKVYQCVCIKTSCPPPSTINVRAARGPACSKKKTLLCRPIVWLGVPVVFGACCHVFFSTAPRPRACTVGHVFTFS